MPVSTRGCAECCVFNDHIRTGQRLSAFRIQYVSSKAAIVFMLTRPAGPVIYAEGETRTLHELLFACYDAGVRNEVSLSCVKKFTRILLQFYGGKLKKWYGLVDIATLLEKIESNLDNVEQMEDFLNLIKELLLFVGRINMWLDLLIPWEDLNKVFKLERRV